MVTIEEPMPGICGRCKNGATRGKVGCRIREYYKIEPPTTLDSDGYVETCNYYNLRYVDLVERFWKHFEELVIQSDDSEILWAESAQRGYGDTYVRSPKYIVAVKDQAAAKALRRYIRAELNQELIRAVGWEPIVKTITADGPLRIQKGRAMSSTTVTAAEMRAKLEEIAAEQAKEQTLPKPEGAEKGEQDDQLEVINVDEIMSHVHDDKLRLQKISGHRYTCTYYDPSVERRQQCSIGDILIAAGSMKRVLGPAGWYWKELGATSCTWSGQSKRRSDATSIDDPNVIFKYQVDKRLWVWRRIADKTRQNN